MSQRRFLGLLLTLGLGWGCDDVGGDYAAEAWGISGQVFFTEPMAEARLTLYRSEAPGAVGEEVATATSDAEGRFSFELSAPGDYLVVAELGGLKWVNHREGLQGTFDADQRLECFALGVEMEEQREVTLSPLSHLTSKAAEALAGGGGASARRDALNAMKLHLTFDPISTPIEVEQIDSAITDAITYHLILDSIWDLSASISRKAGMSADGMTPPELIGFIEDDLAGTPLGVLDGVGESGPLKLSGSVDYAFTGEVLRGDLADALEKLISNDPKWDHLSVSSLSNLLKNLRCSASPLFLECELGQDLEDETPPLLELVESSAGDVLEGEVELKVEVKDPESGVQSVSLSAGGVDYQPIRQDGDVFVFEVDTREIKGAVLAGFRFSARNHSGAEGELLVEYELSNYGSADLYGYVFKGLGVHVSVKAYGLDQDRELLLGETSTDLNGRFDLRVEEFYGPVLLVAHGSQPHMESSSEYLDEATGEMVPWLIDQEMQTVLPEFDPARDDNSVIISPLAHLAWAAAVWSDQNGGLAKLTAYERTLEVLGEHFGLSTPGASDVILYVKPTGHNEPFSNPMRESDHFMFALGCISQQALDLSTELWPNEDGVISALDLVNAYRDDILSDGFLDGRNGVSNVEFEGAVESIALIDPFRGELAESCYRWAVKNSSEVGIEARNISTIMDHMSTNEQELFHPEIFGSGGFDRDPPVIGFEFVDNDNGVRIDQRFKGQVSLVAQALDIKSNLVDFRAEVSRCEVIHDLVDLDGNSGNYEITLDCGELDDGPVIINFIAEDLYENRSNLAVELMADNYGPEFEISFVDNEVGVYSDGWAKDSVDLFVDQVSLEVVNVSLVEIKLTDEVSGDIVFSMQIDDMALLSNFRETLDLHNLQQESYRLDVWIFDDIGNVSTQNLIIKIDNTPPDLGIFSVSSHQGGRFAAGNENTDFDYSVNGMVFGAFDQIVDSRSGIGEIVLYRNDVQVDRINIDSLFPDENGALNGIGFPLDIEESYGQNTVFVVEIVDKLGNSSQMSKVLYGDNVSAVCNINASQPFNEPDMSLSSDTSNFERFPFSNISPVSLALYCEDDSGLNYSARYQFDNEQEYIQSSESGGFMSIRPENENVFNDGEYSLDVYVYDAVGNSSRATMGYRIDNTPPSIEFMINNQRVNVASLTSLQDQSVRVSYNVSDNFGFSADPTHFPYLHIINTENDEIVFSDYTNIENFDQIFDFGSSGRFSITVTTRDLAGNEAIYEYFVVIFDEAPSFMFLPSTILDESEFTAVRSGNRVILDSSEASLIQIGDNSDISSPIRINKLLHTWGDDNENIPVLKFKIEEDNPLNNNLNVYYSIGRFGDGEHGRNSEFVCSGANNMPTANKIIDGDEDRSLYPYFRLKLDVNRLNINPTQDPERDVPNKIFLFTCDSFEEMTVYELNLDLNYYPAPLLIEQVSSSTMNNGIQNPSVNFEMFISLISTPDSNLIFNRFRISKPDNSMDSNVSFEEASMSTVSVKSKLWPSEQSIPIENLEGECNYSFDQEIGLVELRPPNRYDVISCHSIEEDVYESNSSFMIENHELFEVSISDINGQIIDVRSRSFELNGIGVIDDNTDVNDIQYSAQYDENIYMWNISGETCIRPFECYSRSWVGRINLLLDNIYLYNAGEIRLNLEIPCGRESCDMFEPKLIRHWIGTSSRRVNP